MLWTVAALLLGAAVASCSHDELGAGQGEQLPLGKYPLMLTASVDGMKTRSAGKDQWAEGDSIGVRIGAYPLMGKYMLHSDGTVMSAIVPLEWQNKQSATVTAWFPYLELGGKKTVSLANQSEGFEPYDFLKAIAEDQSVEKQVALNFKHQMVKVSCTLVQDDISDAEFNTAKLSIAGYTEASFSETSLTGDAHGWITPYTDSEVQHSEYKGLYADYEALLVPQNMSGKGFIKIDAKININGRIVDRTFIYTPDDADFKAGSHYKYTITVKKDRIVVQSVSASWKDEGVLHPAEPATFRVKLEGLSEESKQELIFGSNVTPAYGDNGDYLLVKGNHFTISYSVNDANMTKVFKISAGTDKDKVERTFKDGSYIFSCYIRSEEVALTYSDYAYAGDLYYADGTWASPELDSFLNINKRPIGIVFKSGAGTGENTDEPSNYGENLTVIHGYAVALKDASSDGGKWGPTGKIAGFANVKKDDIDTSSPYSGYNYTKIIKGLEKYKDYWAFNVAVNYNDTVPAPPESSGWYLPSVLQLEDICSLNNRAALFDYAQGKDFKIDTNATRYWSTIPSTDAKAYSYIFYPGNTGPNSIDRYTNSSAKSTYVRAVLTF